MVAKFEIITESGVWNPPRTPLPVRMVLVGGRGGAGAYGHPGQPGQEIIRDLIVDGPLTLHIGKGGKGVNGGQDGEDAYCILEWEEPED